MSSARPVGSGQRLDAVYLATPAARLQQQGGTLLVMLVAVVWLSTARCEVQGVAYIAAGSAAGGGLRNVPGPGGRLLLNTKHRV